MSNGWERGMQFENYVWNKTNIKTEGFLGNGRADTGAIS